MPFQAWPWSSETGLYEQFDILTMPMAGNSKKPPTRAEHRFL